ncbi:sodium-independent sulfate anion transporter-like [Plodia interpunctella]|uniref:sodium-independent sulfate anion transporter-like n=1 Tax=Plodia interpunctella TaxID=58824 RepID=UPI0023685B49|nr:sodium-independent sulfate anion transporter-like [Plodia interpunctella]
MEMCQMKAGSDAEEGSLADSGGAGGGWRAAARRRLPVLEWARRYDRLAAAADAVAGVTLGLMLVPQSIAYATLADLPVQYGLYSAFMGTILYTFLGTVKEVSIGPTSLMALLTLQICHGLPVEFAVLLTFLSGCVVLLMALLRLGCLVDLISPSVTSGFTSATAVIIVSSQIKGLLGLRFAAETPWENAEQILARLHLVRYSDLALGLVCCVALLLLRKLKDVKISPKRPVLRKSLWLVSIARNALVVLAAAVFAYCLHDPDDPIVKLSGVVKPGLPSLRLPAFSVTVNNSTLGFTDMVRTLGAGVVMVPLVMVLANIAIAKAFTTGGTVDASQEMLTLGLCNLAGSLVRALPACGAFTRSAVSHASGVRTPAAGLYSGAITLLALAFLTEWFYFIPTACLSAVLICAVVFMIDFDTVRTLWRESRSELFVLGVTFAVGVACSVELSVPAGVLADLALLLRSLARAPAPAAYCAAKQYGEGRGVVVMAPGALLYLNAERFAARAAARAAAHSPLYIDCSRLAFVDHTGAQVLDRLCGTLAESGRTVVVFGARGAPARLLARRPRLASAAAYAAPAASAAPAAPAAPREDAALLVATTP